MTRIKYALILLVYLFFGKSASAQSGIDNLLPVRGFCIAAPNPNQVDTFIKFITGELASRQVNTLVLRIDFNYQYKTYPELRSDEALSKREVKRLVDVCRENNIRIIPQINLLGHQSWANKTGNLLRVFPEFDETPRVKMPEKYEWPNADGLYCKSYCPLHPEVHNVVFALIDEICEVFESDAFHAGMDEVFYIGDDKCTRCAGRDKAELYAAEVNAIRNHLALMNRQLWIWGDRLIDGKTTGIGSWEASFNNTYRAIDMIPKDVMICDWHYEKPHQTAVYFAMKGLNVITCPWRNPDVAVLQARDMLRFRESSSPDMKKRFQGVMQTVWTGAGQFLDEFYGVKANSGDEKNSQANCFRAMFGEIKKMNDAK